MPQSLLSPRFRLLCVAMSAAVLTLAVASVMHVHGLSDPDAHHPTTVFLLQHQILSGVLLTCVLGLVYLRLPRRSLLPVTGRPRAWPSQSSPGGSRAPPPRPA